MAMKNLVIYLITACLSIAMLHACGPSEEELRQQAEAERQAEQDSLQRVWEAELEQMRLDSIEQARQDSIALAEQMAEELEREQERERERASRIEFTDDGNFTVQVRSWRSEEKAEEHAYRWMQRGFEHVYVQQYGDESTGDVWFRVRMGHLRTHEMAKRLQQKLKEDYDTDSWVGNVVRN
jgi:hypothetical protein